MNLLDVDRRLQAVEAQLSPRLPYHHAATHKMGSSDPLSVAGDGVGVSIILAASDAPQEWKNAAGAAYTGNGVTDNVMIQAAHDALSSVGGEILYSPGHFVLAATITYSNKPIKERGCGIGVTHLKWTGGTNGFTFSFNDKKTNLTVSDMTLATNQQDVGAAIDADWPTVSSSIYPTCVFERLAIIPGDAPTLDGWAYGIKLTDPWNFFISKVHIVGREDVRTMTAGIDLSGEGGGYVHQLGVFWAITGLNVGGTIEGVAVSDSAFVAVTNGIVMSTAAAEPGTSITGCHMDAFSTGITLLNRPQLSITGCLIYKRSDSTVDFTGIKLTTTDFARITGNFIINTAGAGAPTDIGIDVVSSTKSVILGNAIQDFDTGIILRASAANCTVVSNIDHQNTTFINDLGSNTVLGGNMESVAGEFVIGGATATDASLDLLARSTAGLAKIDFGVIGDDADYASRIIRDTGANGLLSIVNKGTGNLQLYTNNILRWLLGGSTGHLLAQTDNTHDIGASGANRPRNTFISGYHELAEIAAPGVSATNGARIYAVDNGAGKTQLVVIFQSGAAQVLATEP